MSMVNRVDRKPERNNKVYIRRIYPGINMPKPVNVNKNYVFQETPKKVDNKPLEEIKIDGDDNVLDVIDLTNTQEETASKPKTKKKSE